MVAQMVGVQLTIEEAMAVRDEVGSVADVTWSKVQSGVITIAATQAFALKRLDALAERLGGKTTVGDIVEAARTSESETREWLAVLAQSIRLQDATWVLELDRVLDDRPDQVEAHRRGLLAARTRRLELLESHTTGVLARMAATVDRANSKVLFNPFKSPVAVRACNAVSTEVGTFRDRVSIGAEHTQTEAKRWSQAASELRDKVAGAARDGAATASQAGGKAVGRATELFRSVDLDGDGIPDKPRAAAVVDDAGAAIKGAASGVSNAVGSIFRRKGRVEPPQEGDQLT